MSYIFIFIIIILILVLIILPPFGRLRFTKHSEKGYLAIDALAFIIAPIIGYGLLFIGMSEIELLDPDSIHIIIAIHIINTIIYFLQHSIGEKISPIARVIFPIIYSIAIGVYLLQIIHLSIALVFVIMPPIGFFGLSYFALFYVLTMTVKSLHLVLKENNSRILSDEKYSSIHFLISGKYATIIQILLSPIYIWLLNSVFVILSEKQYSIMHAFIESSDGLLSEGVCNHCQPVTEYVCTVAGFGSDKLVKPLCYGERHGNPIRVNRQIQVCNAFEELLSQQVPWLQRVLRAGYDGLQIPVHKWKQVKWFANLIYLLLKPLELFCLLYVYTFDTQPEFRISKQYLPAKFLKNLLTFK